MSTDITEAQSIWTRDAYGDGSWVELATVYDDHVHFIQPPWPANGPDSGTTSQVRLSDPCLRGLTFDDFLYSIDYTPTVEVL